MVGGQEICPCIPFQAGKMRQRAGSRRQGVGIDKYDRGWDGEASQYERKTKSAYPFLSNWIKNNASDLQTYARELREKAGK